MTDNILEKLFEHNHWANLEIIQACSTLSDEQLDTQPTSSTYGTIRQTLLHFIFAQQGYFRLLTEPVEERRLHTIAENFDELEKSARLSGESLQELVRELEYKPLAAKLQTTDNWYIEPWLVMVQIINHATEHREQIKNMLTALGVTPPEIDGWSFGEFTHTAVPM